MCIRDSTLTIEDDDYGDLFITLPVELWEEMGWKAGTKLEYTEETDGSIILKAVDE